MVHSDIVDLLSARNLADLTVMKAEQRLYKANQELAQAILIRDGINPDDPDDELIFPLLVELHGWLMTIEPNGEIGEYDVDVQAGGVLREAVKHVG